MDTVVILTKQPFEPYARYIQRVRASRLATKVKLADLTHNLSDLACGQLRDKYELALFWLSDIDATK